MTYSHHMYHAPGLTDLSKMRAEATRLASTTPVIIHLHPYEDGFDGCDGSVHGSDEHETYGADVDTPAGAGYRVAS